MKRAIPIEDFAPQFARDAYTKEEVYNLSPFFTNLDQPVYVPLIFSPEVIGALCSRTSRAAQDLRKIFLDEYLTPFLNSEQNSSSSPLEGEEQGGVSSHKTPTPSPFVRGRVQSISDSVERSNVQYGEDLKAFVQFLHKHPIEKIFSNPRARSFYAKWLAQYGDDSIAQMAGMHLVYSGISQVAIKHIEDQRIGLAPLEKSTRYVDYSSKIYRHYRYYTDPTLKKMGVLRKYRDAMDGLFETYTKLLPKLQVWFKQRFPDETDNVIEKKSFDTLRGLLPTSTLSQLALFGNGQAFEYMLTRSLKHPLGEIRWAGEMAYEELNKVVPSFLRRVKDPDSKDVAEAYQEFKAETGKRMMPFVDSYINSHHSHGYSHNSHRVDLVDFDSDGESKVIAGMLFNASNNHSSWNDTYTAVRAMTDKEKEQVIDTYLAGRTQRWQKVGRAFENTYVRFDITMNIGAWRDLHRHRMLTQQRQHFSVNHGFDVPQELIDSGFDKEYGQAIRQVEGVYEKIAKHDLDIAQYAVTLAHRLRFMQWENVRECFWEMELRSIPEGHPDYRKITQEKFKLFEKAFPLISKHMRVNMGDYDFARRGQEEKIQAKLKELQRMNVA